MGPCLGPLFGGWISYRTGQWRWIYWVLFIIVGAVFALTLVMPETLSTIILKKKAAKLNKGNDSNIYITESDLHVIPLSSRLKTAMLRPFILMFMEPIVLFMSFYLSFVYSLLYATFFAFPIAFEEIRGWNAGMTGVSFVSIIVSDLHRRTWRNDQSECRLMVQVGILGALVLMPIQERLYARKPGSPESRLYPMMLGAM
jgi:MFS family permease